MTQKKRTYSAEFKARVALSAIREEGTLAQLSSKYNINPNMISKWKHQALQQMAEGFGKKGPSLPQSSEEEIQKLHAKIGQLTVEVDFLEQASKRLGLWGGKKW
jgi:transposase